MPESRYGIDPDATAPDVAADNEIHIPTINFACSPEVLQHITATASQSTDQTMSQVYYFIDNFKAVKNALMSIK